MLARRGQFKQVHHNRCIATHTHRQLVDRGGVDVEMDHRGCEREGIEPAGEIRRREPALRVYLVRVGQGGLWPQSIA